MTETLERRKRLPSKRICTIDGCDRPHNAFGWCQAHYKQWQKYGDPLGHAPQWPERFWNKVNTTEGCWIWTGAVSAEDGYGRAAGADGRVQLVHRLAYALVNGEIPEGLHLDHVCHTLDSACPGGRTCSHRRCVRPDHLDPVTQLVNNQRARRIGRRKAECLRGHSLLDPANLYFRKDRRPECKRCVRYRAAVLRSGGSNR